jgi:16S rRNA G527 N7-methylase RsmG
MTKIKFDKLDPRILPEMSAKVSFLSQEITESDQQPVMAVAKTTIANRDGRSIVYRIKTGDANQSSVEAVTIRQVRPLGDLVEVAGDLKAGDKIVSNPPASLKDGERVNIGTL